jgi:CHASE3 domain sensor protein
MLSDYDSFIETLESLGESNVSSKLSQGVWSSQRKKWASDWLQSKASFRRDAREEETLSIAREANELARAANTSASEANRIASDALIESRSSAESARKQARWAMWAAIIATIAIIIAAITYIKTP